MERRGGSGRKGGQETKVIKREEERVNAEENKGKRRMKRRKP